MTPERMAALEAEAADEGRRRAGRAVAGAPVAWMRPSRPCSGVVSPAPDGLPRHGQGRAARAPAADVGTAAEAQPARSKPAATAGQLTTFHQASM